MKKFLRFIVALLYVMPAIKYAAEQLTSATYPNTTNTFIAIFYTIMSIGIVGLLVNYNSDDRKDD